MTPKFKKIALSFLTPLTMFAAGYTYKKVEVMQECENALTIAKAQRYDQDDWRAVAARNKAVNAVGDQYHESIGDVVKSGIAGLFAASALFYTATRKTVKKAKPPAP